MRPDHRRRPVALAAALAVVHALPAAAQPVAPLRRALRVGAATAGGRGVALTFDDGPHPEGTPAVLRALSDHGVRATFFLVGEQVVRWPALAAEIAAAGHAVGLHGDRHRNLLRVGPRATARDLDRGWERVAEATGVAPAAYRPPYGIFTAAALAVARRRGWRPLLWSHWGRDWQRHAMPAAIAARATAGIGPGAVVLLHDADHYSAPGSWRRTADAVPRVLARLGELGLPVVEA
jgi:peptidoglycan/xylan/chitin deacetylase (PgdA/CDA1 family)